MKMTFRWYGEGHDRLKLSDIKQIPVGDGSTALFYEKNMIQDDYNAMAKYILDFTEKYNMSFPG